MTGCSRGLRRWFRRDHSFVALPYVPIAGYLSLIGWMRLGHGGFAPEGTLTHVLPPALIFVWTLATALGGLLSVIGSSFQFTRTESSGLVLLLMGSLFYGSGICWAEGHADPTVIAVSVAIALMSALRMRILSKARIAQRTAARIEATAPHREE